MIAVRLALWAVAGRGFGTLAALAIDVLVPAATPRAVVGFAAVVIAALTVAANAERYDP